MRTTSTTTRTIDRRSVLSVAAWSVPAVAIAAALPATAASGNSAGAFSIAAICHLGGPRLRLTASPTAALPAGTLVTLTGGTGDVLIWGAPDADVPTEESSSSPWDIVLSGGLAAGDSIDFSTINDVTIGPGARLSGIVTLPSEWTGSGAVTSAVVFSYSCTPNPEEPE